MDNLSNFWRKNSATLFLDGSTKEYDSRFSDSSSLFSAGHTTEISGFCSKTLTNCGAQTEIREKLKSWPKICSKKSLISLISGLSFGALKINQGKNEAFVKILCLFLQKPPKGL